MADKIHPVDKFVGAKVRILRLQNKLTQTDLANRLGITFQQVQKYESGRNRISASRLYNISRILNADIAFFFENVPPFNSSTGDADIDDNESIYAYITTSDTFNFMKAFNKLKNTSYRKAITDLVELLAKHQSKK